jgi:C1A family cysteine protease
MAEKQGTLLADIDTLRPAIAERLRPLWITTAEELVTTAVNAKGRLGLAELLDMTPAEVDELAQDLLPKVSDAVQAEMGVVPRAFGQGAWDEFDASRPRSLSQELELPEELPERVSLVDGMPPVRDQGIRGTCVAHACTAVREYMTGNTGIDLSEQFLYWAARQHLVLPFLKNRPGSLLLYGMKALEKHGVCPETDWPYNPKSVPGDEEQGTPPPEIQQKAQAFRTERHILIWPRDIDHVKTYLAGGYPVAFTVPTFNYWPAVMIRRTGAIRLPLRTEGTHNPAQWLESAHAVCLAGYQDDDSVPGGGYFIVRNSWSPKWATGCPDGAGYGWMPYAYLQKYGLTAFTAV